MVKNVALSKETIALINEIKKLPSFKNSPEKNSMLPNIEESGTEINSKVLVAWLRESQNKVDKKNRYHMAALTTALLKDFKALVAPEANKPENKTGKLASLKFLFLAIAGTIFVGCEGFDGISSLLGSLSFGLSIPHLLIFAAGVLFSLLAIVVFFAFDLVEISKNLGVQIKNTPKMADVYLQQLQTIKSLRQEVDNSLSKEKTTEEYLHDLQILEMLQSRYSVLIEARKYLNGSLNNPFLKVAKLATAGIAGILFFSGGFFAGQTVALAIAGLFAVSAASTFWPVLIVSVGVGIAALSVYWFVERPGIENLVGRWVGLDKEKIDELCERDEAVQELKAIEVVIEKVNRFINLKQASAVVKIEAQPKERQSASCDVVESVENSLLIKDIAQPAASKPVSVKQEENELQYSASFFAVRHSPSVFAASKERSYLNS